MEEIVEEEEVNVRKGGVVELHNNISNNNTVEIILRAIGPARPSRLRVPSPIKVCHLRKLIAENDHLPIENLRLILRGNVLHDCQNGDDVNLQLNSGGIDSLIVAVKPKPPVKHVRDGFDDDDEEEDLKFQLPQSSSRWKRRLYSFLHNKLKLPDILLMAIFTLSLKMWVIIILWFLLAPVAHRWDLGPLYILGTGFGIIILNLGQRQPGDVSAYSVFNEDFRELPGTLNADRLDRDIRADSLIVAVKPKPPVKHVRDGFDDDDEEEDLKFQLPQSSSRWKRRLYSFLHNKLKLPDILLVAIFTLSLKMWFIIILWFLLAPVAHRWDLGPLYILGTGFGIIILNLGQRQPGDVSAYSVFNEDFRELPGTLNADRLDRDIRAGQF